MAAEADAFGMVEENYPEHLRNEAYALVLEQAGRFIEKNNLRATNVPKRVNSALYVLTLDLLKKNLVMNSEEAEKHLVKQLKRIRDGGYDVVQQLFDEILECCHIELHDK